jgi:hypothetical protein
MEFVDLFLNLAGLLMWVSWRGIHGLEAAGSAGTILGNLRAASRARDPRWGYLVGLIGMLVFRAMIYRQVGPALPWHPSWEGPTVTLSFRADSFARMLSYSVLSFGWLLSIWYTAWVAVLVINRPPRDRDGVTRAIRKQLGLIGSLPTPVLVLLPPVLAASAWGVVGWLAAEYRIMPALRDGTHLVQQAVVVGLSHYTVLRWFVVGLLGLHLLNLYVYLGNHAFWDFVQQTGERLSRPFAFFRLGQMDLSALPAILVAWAGFTLFGQGFPWLKASLPGIPAWVEFGIWPTIFRSLPWG